MTQPSHPSLPSTLHGKRGRPPGTGKNDTDRLRKIAALMAADPGLKPTTAIKQIGETDPSTIRRLRDKFHEQQSALVAQIGTDLGKHAAAAPTRSDVSRLAATVPATVAQLAAQPAAIVSAETITSSPVALKLVEPQPELGSGPMAQGAVPRAAQAPLRAPSQADEIASPFTPGQTQHPFMLFGKWFGNGIETAAVLFEHQMLFAQTMLKTAPVKAMWRQQLVATEYLLMLSGPGQRIAPPAEVPQRLLTSK
jgi:hypothetical protein